MVILIIDQQKEYIFRFAEEITTEYFCNFKISEFPFEFSCFRQEPYV